MKLHSPTFARRLRRGVRAAVRRSPTLRREYRAAHRRRTHVDAAVLLRPAVSAGLAMLVWQILVTTSQPSAALAALTLWGLAFVFVHAQRLLSVLYGSTDLWTLILLPVTEETIFRWELQKWVRSAAWLLLDLLGGFSVLACWGTFTAAQWMVVLPVSLLAWLQVLALAALGAAFVPRFPYAQINSLLFVLLFVLFATQSVIGDAVRAFLTATAAHLNLLLPTGWAPSLFEILLPNGSWHSLLFLVPLGATIATLRSSLGRLEGTYEFSELVAPEAPDLLPDPEESATMPEPAPNQPRRVGLTTIEELVESRRFLATPDWWTRGRLEHWFRRWLTPRERALAEFIFPDEIRIGSAWWRTCRTLAVAGLVAAVARQLAPTIQHWVLAGGLFVAMSQALAQLGATGRAFVPVASSGVNVPFYAGYAIGFRELARLLFKYTAIQIPFALLFAVAMTAMTSWLVGWPPAGGWMFGLKVGGLLIMSRFLFVTFAFSSNTNDTSRVRVRSLLLLALAIIVCLAFAGLTAASLFVPQQGLAWALWGLAGVTAYSMFRVYGWFYHANCFDLMHLPQR